MPDWLGTFISTPEARSGLISLLVIVASTYIVRWIQPKSRVVWSSPHAFSFVTPSNDANPAGSIVHTATVWVQNVGRSTAEDVEVHFNFQPQHFEVFPTRKNSCEINPDGFFAISTPNLTAREHFTIQLLSVASNLPSIQNVRWQDGTAKPIPMGPMQIFSLSVTRIMQALVILGAFTIVYLVVRGIVALAG